MIIPDHTWPPPWADRAGFATLKPNVLPEVLIECGFFRLDKGRKVPNGRALFRELANTCCYFTILRKLRGEILRTRWVIVEDLLTALIWGPSTAEDFKRVAITDKEFLALFQRLFTIEDGEPPGETGCPSTLSPGGDPNPAAEDDPAAGGRRIKMSITITLRSIPPR